MKWRLTCHKMASDKLKNGAQHGVKWPPISWKMVPNVVLTSLIAGYLYLNFLSLQFSYLYHSQSFQKG